MRPWVRPPGRGRRAVPAVPLRRRRGGSGAARGGCSSTMARRRAAGVGAQGGQSAACALPAVFPIGRAVCPPAGMGTEGGMLRASPGRGGTAMPGAGSGHGTAKSAGLRVPLPRAPSPHTGLPLPPRKDRSPSLCHRNDISGTGSEEAAPAGTPLPAEGSRCPGARPAGSCPGAGAAAGGGGPLPAIVCVAQSPRVGTRSAAERGRRAPQICVQLPRQSSVETRTQSFLCASPCFVGAGDHIKFRCARR